MKVVRKVALPVIFTAALVSGVFANKKKADIQTRDDFSKQAVMTDKTAEKMATAQWIFVAAPLALSLYGLGVALYGRKKARDADYFKANYKEYRMATYGGGSCFGPETLRMLDHQAFKLEKKHHAQKR